MSRIIIIIFLLVPILSINGQKDTINNKVKYAWPYLDECPRYIAVYGGFSGRNLEFKEIGINISLPKNLAASSISMSPMMGPQITYRSSPDLKALSVGFYIKAGILVGIEYQHRWNELNKFNSIRPAIGLHLFRFDFEYGYNFFLTKHNTQMANGDFRIGLTIPILNLTKN